MQLWTSWVHVIIDPNKSTLRSDIGIALLCDYKTDLNFLCESVDFHCFPFDVEISFNEYTICNRLLESIKGYSYAIDKAKHR